MKRYCFFFLFISSFALGQGVLLQPKSVLSVVNGITRPVANATITVCAANTSGLPCSPALVGVVFSDAGLTQPLSNPFFADANGNYQFAIASGSYTVTETAFGFVGYSYQISPAAGSPGSPSGSIQGNKGGAFSAIPNASFNTTTGAISTSAAFTASGGATVSALTVTGCGVGQFAKGDGSGCAAGTGAGNIVFTSLNSNNLGTAIAAAGTSGYVFVDAPVTLAASSLSINTSNLTIECTSLTSPIIFPSVSSKLLIANGANAFGVNIKGCSFQGPDLATATGAPIVVGNNGLADGFKLLNSSINGFGSTGGNGIVEVVNGSHIEIGNNRAGDIATGSSCTVSTASWAAPVSGTMFGLETITFAASGSCSAAFPPDFAVGNAIYCSGMSPIIFNHPGDAQSSAFAQIMSVAYPSLTVQQLVNPGTYTSGGTCQSGIGNGEADIALNVVGNNNQLSDWNIHDNDVPSITGHQATVGAVVNGVRISGNALHPGFNNGYYWGLEFGSFSGATGAMAQAYQNVAESNNVCRMAADTGGGTGLAGCFSQGNIQGLTETGNECYSGGHVYTIQCDENAGAQNVSVTGGVYNGLGGGSITDINRMSRGTYSGSILLYACATCQFMSGGAANGGVGAQAPAVSSYNTISGLTMVSRIEICPPSNSAWANNVCGGQISSISQSAGVATLSFANGVKMPWLAAGQTLVIAGNNTTGICAASTFNGLQTVVSVIGGGTGFTFANGSVSGPCTLGKATPDGLISTGGVGTTAYALFTSGPSPFKVGDTTLNIQGSTSSGGSFNALNQTVTGVGQGPGPYWVSWVSSTGSGLGGNGFAGNYNGKFFSFQNNIAAGSVVDGNIISNLNIVGNGGTTSQGISFANNAATSGSMDRNQFVHVRMSDVGIAFNLAGTGPTLAPTNTKIELGSFTNINQIANWNNNASISCDSANPACLVGTLTGLAPAGAGTEFLYDLGQSATSVFNNAGATTENKWQVAKANGTAQGLFCGASAVATTGVVTVRDNSTNQLITVTMSGALAANCTAGLSGFCLNDTVHTFAVTKGDLLDIQVATSANDTLANLKCQLYVWYKDN